MGQYEARGLRSCQHHMTVAMHAMLFILDQLIKNSAVYPLLNSNDIVEMLNHYLPILFQLQTQYELPQRAIKAAYCKQILKDQSP